MRGLKAAQAIETCVLGPIVAAQQTWLVSLILANSAGSRVKFYRLVIHKQGCVPLSDQEKAQQGHLKNT